MGLGKLVNGKYRPISPYENSWADQERRAKLRHGSEKCPFCNHKPCVYLDECKSFAAFQYWRSNGKQEDKSRDKTH